jgi:hypothetical protein
LEAKLNHVPNRIRDTYLHTIYNESFALKRLRELERIFRSIGIDNDSPADESWKRNVPNDLQGLWLAPIHKLCALKLDFFHSSMGNPQFPLPHCRSFRLLMVNLNAEDREN